MKVVAPLRIKAVSADRARKNETRIVQIALRDQVTSPVQTLALPVNRLGEIFKECDSRRIENGMDGIEAESVNMKVRLPIQRIFNEVAADMITVRTIEI